jgi:hypothetical protein
MTKHSICAFKKHIMEAGSLVQMVVCLPSKLEAEFKPQYRGWGGCRVGVCLSGRILA